ncbi:hypothetical protein ACT18_00905 [Mycolicibacter kumamotonensis]|uniref:Uncharacterized protein n=1 Tax=Mycolicibacter kumamotonensis TaxID=354243 RepID=A0A1B8SLF9_9MYCO|nr:hypothetical protein ACT18_00905 [Mycolicibacter kumamotonensis]
MELPYRMKCAVRSQNQVADLNLLDGSITFAGANQRPWREAAWAAFGIGVGDRVTHRQQDGLFASGNQCVTKIASQVIYREVFYALDNHA